MRKKATEAATEIEIQLVEQAVLEVCVVGTTPLICNRLSKKAREQILLPPPPKTAATRASTLKHNPLQEFRDSGNILLDESAPTYLALPAACFKLAMAAASLDLQGAKKSQLARNIFVPGVFVPLYGGPRMLMSPVRTADIGHTPDIRTRLILPRWAALFQVRFTIPLLRETTIYNLAAAAGINVGVGDWRAEKGNGDYGSFRLANPEDPELIAIQQEGGRAAQRAAMKDPDYYDDDTRELYEWFEGEARRRGFRLREEAP